MSRLDELIQKLCLNGVEYKAIEAVTILPDRRYFHHEIFKIIRVSI